MKRVIAEKLRKLEEAASYMGMMGDGAFYAVKISDCDYAIVRIKNQELTYLPKTVVDEIVNAEDTFGIADAAGRYFAAFPD